MNKEQVEYAIYCKEEELNSAYCPHSDSKCRSDCIARKKGVCYEINGDWFVEVGTCKEFSG